MLQLQTTQNEFHNRVCFIVCQVHDVTKYFRTLFFFKG